VASPARKALTCHLPLFFFFFFFFSFFFFFLLPSFFFFYTVGRVVVAKGGGWRGWPTKEEDPKRGKIYIRRTVRAKVLNGRRTTTSTTIRHKFIAD
jgi:hypothetical protein